MELPVGTKVGPYTLGEKLGEGGHFGFCKLASEKKTGQKYAVKHILKQR